MNKICIFATVGLTGTTLLREATHFPNYLEMPPHSPEGSFLNPQSLAQYINAGTALYRLQTRSAGMSQSANGLRFPSL